MASTNQDMSDSPWDNFLVNDMDNFANDSPHVFDNFTNMDYAESPGGLQMQPPSKADMHGMGDVGAQQNQQSGMPVQSSTSLDTSSQDSSSDTSSRLKNKNTSESPISDAGRNGDVKKEDSMMELEAPKMQMFGAGSRPMRNMPMDANMGDNMADNSMFDFTSGNSSPINPATFENALSLNGQVHNMVRQNMNSQFKQESPIQTINPATFSLGGDASRNHSPSMMNATMFNHSPNAVFSTPSSDSNETYNPNQAFNMAQNPPWNAEFNNQFTSPGALQLTPSPNHNGMASSANQRNGAGPRGRSKLHIAPISTKSRVETQINVIMTLETPPPNTEFLHLPLHTIAKSKLLAKEEVDRSKALELHTMLVCSSAMHNPELKEKAMQRAAQQNNTEIQQRAEQQRDNGEEDKNDLKNIPEEDKPSNGGEVRICNNCIQRERKRAGRKKLKKEEEQQHWERYETERVVVFNSNEFLSFKVYEPGQQMHKDAAYPPGREYVPPDGSMHVTAAMRIACYCRHQSEKEGFQVIFTMKDQGGNVVAQEMSDSILITDDHKTHPSAFVQPVGEAQMAMYAPMYATGIPTHGMPAGLQQSYSMVDLPSHMQQGFPSSRSTGNLQALGLGQFNPQSHVHQLPNSGFTSQTTSATMTPTSLSRPASPNSAGNSGPNKKRKSSSFHKRVPSGLTMTPRVDTNHGPSSNMSSAMSATSPEQLFSPTNGGFNPQMHTDGSYMTIPNNNGPAQFMNSGPPTPAENQGPFNFNQAPPNSLRRDMPQQVPDYYQSLPGSRVGSRAPSPVSGARVNLAAYARQQMAPSSQAPPRQQAYSNQAVPGSAGSDMDPTALPMIHKLTPVEGPTAGGTEVSIYGRNFTNSCQVFFGEQAATAITYYGDQSLLCVSPPGRPGAVHVTIVPAGSVPQYSANQTSRPIFNYKNSNERMMEMALRSLSQQQIGNPNSWYQLAQHHASQFVNNNISRAGLGQGYDGGNMHSAGPQTQTAEDGESDELPAFDEFSPPSYDDLFPNRSLRRGHDHSHAKKGGLEATVDACADEKCSSSSDEDHDHASVESAVELSVCKETKGGPLHTWVPALVLLGVMLVPQLLVALPDFSPRRIDSKPPRSYSLPPFCAEFSTDVTV